MKEKIYTIPVNEAYDTDCECPLCYLSEKLELEAVDYALGAAMMEPDYRMESNKIGYCNKHFAQIFEQPNKLSLALVLDTHLEELRKKISTYKKQTKSVASSGLFKKNKPLSSIENICTCMQSDIDSCMVCNKINHTMQRYVDVLFFLWKTEPEFRMKFAESKGVCLPHLKMLTNCAPKHLSQKEIGDFLYTLYEQQEQNLLRIQEDIHKFTLKFDYRNQDMEWGSAKDAPIRTIEKISGKITNRESKS